MQCNRKNTIWFVLIHNYIVADAMQDDKSFMSLEFTSALKIWTLIVVSVYDRL